MMTLKNSISNKAKQMKAELSLLAIILTLGLTAEV